MLTVADVMTRRPVMVAADATVAQALEAMRERGISSVLVPPQDPDGPGEYGIVTMRDVIAKVVRPHLDPEEVRLADIVSWRLVTARPEWPLRQAAELMARARVRRLPVEEGGELVGLISDTDLFTALVPQPRWTSARQTRKERALQRAARTGPARTVTDLMSSPALTISPTESVDEAVRKMAATGVSSLLVTQDGEGVGGIITKRDVVTKVVAAGRDPARTRVEEIASTPVRTIDPEATIEVCSARMAAEGVRRFPVARGGNIVGIISDTDILAAVMAHRWRGQPGRRWPTTYLVADVMKTPPVEIQPVGVEPLAPELSLWDAAARLSAAGVRSLPVVQEGRVIGIVGEADILRAIEERGGGD